MMGKDRVDLAVDPPPDLAIEVDVTSKTQLEAYVKLGVPELWVYDSSELKFFLLQAGQYPQVSVSPTFPEFPVLDWISEVLVESATSGRSPTLRAFRQKIRQAVR